MDKTSLHYKQARRNIPTLFSLTPDQKKRLDWLAEKRGEPRSVLVREALRRFLDNEEKTT